MGLVVIRVMKRASIFGGAWVGWLGWGVFLECFVLVMEGEAGVVTLLFNVDGVCVIL